jgi:hypothetical protein
MPIDLIESLVQNWPCKSSGYVHTWTTSINEQADVAGKGGTGWSIGASSVMWSNKLKMLITDCMRGMRVARPTLASVQAEAATRATKGCVKARTPDARLSRRSRLQAARRYVYIQATNANT